MLTEKEANGLLIYILIAFVCLFVPDLLYTKACGFGWPQVPAWLVTCIGFFCCIRIGALAERRMQ
jgi:hypothetical protein